MTSSFGAFHKNRVYVSVCFCHICSGTEDIAENGLVVITQCCDGPARTWSV